jgi:hypothetical protein
LPFKKANISELNVYLTSKANVSEKAEFENLEAKIETLQKSLGAEKLATFTLEVHDLYETKKKLTDEDDQTE